MTAHERTVRKHLRIVKLASPALFINQGKSSTGDIEKACGNAPQDSESAGGGICNYGPESCATVYSQ